MGNNPVNILKNFKEELIMKRIVSLLLSLLVIAVIETPTMAYDGTNYYNNSYSYYSSNYYMSEWTESLQDLYGSTWYEPPQRFAERSEMFLIGWRAINNSLLRQRLTALSTNYENAPFTDLSAIVPNTQPSIKGMCAMNILQGYYEDDGTMTARLQNNITRAEAAVVYVRFNSMWLHMGDGYSSDGYMGYDNYYDNNTNYYNNYNFNDTMYHWAKPEISIAAANGIILGKNDGKYYPEENLTVEQLWAIMDRWVGYGGIEREDIAKALEQTFKVKCGNISISNNTGYYSGSKVNYLRSSSTSKTIKRGTSTVITFAVSPSSISNLKYSCTTTNSSYVSIKDHWYSNGKISVSLYGNRTGTNVATITVKTLDGSNKTATTKISVTNDSSNYYNDDDDGEITSLTLSPSNVTLYTSGTSRSKQVSVKVNPSSADSSMMYYESANENLVYVDNIYERGSYSYATLVARGTRTGSTSVRVRTGDGSNLTKTIYVTVKKYNDYDDYYNDDEDYYYIKSLTPSKSSLSLKSGETSDVYVSINPTYATDKDVVWESNNTNIVKISSQYISGSKAYATIVAGNIAGNATLRAIAQDGSGEIAVINYSTISGSSNSQDTPVVTLEGAQKTYVGQEITLRVKAIGDYTSFSVTPNMVFMGSKALSMISCEPSGQGVYTVKLLAVEPGVAGICIKQGAAYNNEIPSLETDGIDIIVFSNKKEMDEYNIN